MTEPATPLRIERLTLTDFRAFPGPAPTCFELDGKNLLVYGENGAGKSSIFHALKVFFSLAPRKSSLDPSESLRQHKNVFSGLDDEIFRVEVALNNLQSPLVWTKHEHPRKHGGTPFREIALRRACLDYRSLLDTNYMQGGEKSTCSH
jgi:AAA15 family ATPase/GTPase